MRAWSKIQDWAERRLLVARLRATGEEVACRLANCEHRHYSGHSSRIKTKITKPDGSVFMEAFCTLCRAKWRGEDQVFW